MSEPAADLARRTPDALDTPCVEWQGARTDSGYGHFGRGDGTYLVHRAVYEAIYGPIPDGLFVLHACDNPPCYNLDHLFLGTAGDNIRDAVAKGRFPGWNTYKTHCKHGHEFTPENTLIQLRAGKPRRRCRTCARETRRLQIARRLGETEWHRRRNRGPYV